MCCTYTHSHTAALTWIHRVRNNPYDTSLNRLNGVDYSATGIFLKDGKARHHTDAFLSNVLAIAKPIISRRNYISHNMLLDTHLSQCVSVRACVCRLATCIIHKFESLFNGSLSRMVGKYLDHTLHWMLIKIVLKVKRFEMKTPLHTHNRHTLIQQRWN